MGRRGAHPSEMATPGPMRQRARGRTRGRGNEEHGKRGAPGNKPNLLRDLPSRLFKLRWRGLPLGPNATGKPANPGGDLLRDLPSRLFKLRWHGLLLGPTELLPLRETHESRSGASPPPTWNHEFPGGRKPFGPREKRPEIFKLRSLEQKYLKWLGCWSSRARHSPENVLQRVFVYTVTSLCAPCARTGPARRARATRGSGQARGNEKIP